MTRGKVLKCLLCGSDFEYFRPHRTKGKEPGFCSSVCRSESNKKRSKAWREANPERARQSKKDCYERNKERYAEANTRNRQLKKEEYSVAKARWVESNRDLVRAMKKRYKVKRSGWESGGFHLSQRALDRLLVIHQGSCAHCRTTLTEGYHWDHVTPLSRGGSHGEGNLVPSCPPCNLQKGNRTVTEWRLWRKRHNLAIL